MSYKLKTLALLALTLHSFVFTWAQTSTLVGNWKMNEGSGATLLDASGSGNNATLKKTKDVTWVTGIEGLALNLPGTTDRYAIAPNSASLNITAAITVAAWIRPIDVSTRTILSKTSPDGYELSINNTNKVQFQFNATTNGTTYRMVSNTSYPSNATTWMHVAATFDGTTSKIYINGILDNSTTYSPATINTNTSGLYIGSLAGSGRWKGALDDVRLYNGALTAGEISAISGLVPVPVPTAPVLISPADASTGIPYNTTLSWNAVSGATKYRAEVSEVSTFVTTVLAQDNIVTTSILVNNFQPNKLYYWRVRASNSTGDGNWSSTWSFTTAPLPTPVAPVLLAPANSSVNIPLNQIISWNPVSGADQYRAEVSESPTFATTFLAQDNITATSVSLTSLLPNTVYYWRIQGSNSSGAGLWSDTWSFTTIPLPPGTVQLLAPANSATDVPLNTTLSWNALSDATGYRVEVSESSTFGTTAFAQDNITNTSVDVTNLSAQTVYYWRVRAGNAGGNGPWSETRSFTTGQPQVALTLFHYWNFNDVTSTTTLTAPTVTLNSGSLTINLAALSLIEAGTLNEFVGSNARNGDPAGAHLRLNNPIGSTVTFNVSTAGFKDIVIKYETRRSTQGAEKQKLYYTLDGTSYIFLQDVSPFNGLPTLVTLDFTSITAVNNNPNFKLQIQFEQGLGGTTGNNRFDNFTAEGTPLNIILPPGQVVTVSPADNQEQVPLRPDLSWQAAQGAVSYDIQVATDNQFSAIVATKTVTGQLTHKLESALNVATNYFWRVRAVNSAGVGPWSTVKTFKTILVAVVYNLAVNEVMSANGGFIADEDGAFSDWVEIVNYGTTPINLQGFGLSDSYLTPLKWVFPSMVLGPGQFLLVWASSKNRTDPAQPLHSNFAIGASGEEVLISAPDGELIDALPPIAIPSDVSRGHLPDGTGQFVFFPIPTPGASNSGGVAGFLAKPNFSVAPGVYTSNVTVALTHSDPTVVIRYTLDGSVPTANSLQFVQPLVIADRSNQPNAHSMIPTNYIDNSSRTWREPSGLVRKGTVIRAKAFKGTSESSDDNTGTYLVLPGRQYTLPVLSVVSPFDSLFGFQRGIYVPGVNYISGEDNTGNYYGEGDAWERPGSLEFFSPELSFQQNIGLRINGGYTRRFPQKSLRILARSEYGKSTLDYPVFKNYPYSSFKRLVLRNSGNDWGHTLFLDAVSHMLVSHIMPTQHYTPSILFLNGEYWGIHNVRERADRFFVGRVYGADADNLDYLTLNAEIQEGDDIHYKEMVNYIDNTDLTNDANYAGVKTRMDVENFTDYYSAEIYYANHDFPQGNIDFWRERVPYNPAAPAGRDGRWRWIFFDVDLGFDDPTLNSVSRLLTQNNAEKNEEWPNVLMRNLVTNQEFKTNLINRIADQLNTAFIPARVIHVIDSIKTLIEPEIPEHSLRWSRPSSVNNWSDDVDVMKAFANARPANVRNHVRTAFGLGSQITLTLDVSDKSHGSINLNSLVINSKTVGLANPQTPFPWQGIYFANVPVKLKALANTGYVFDHWVINGAVDNNIQITLTPTANTSIKAYFTNSSGVTPELISPANLATNVAVSPASFSWAEISGTTSYRLEVSLTSDFINPFYDQSGITTANRTVNGLLNGAVYYWRVMGTGSYGSSDWSNTWSFTTVGLPLPGAVTLISPANAASNIPLSPTLQWSTSTNADFYTVQVSTASDFSSFTVNQNNVLTTSLQVGGLLNNTIYYWRVRGNNVQGTSPWSSTRSFTTVDLVGKLLVGHWKMNEGSGATLIDNSGFSNNAILQNPNDITWTTGKEGLALNTPGTTDRFGIAPNSASLNITDAITVAAWIRPIELSSRTILSKTNTDGYEFGLNSSNKVQFRFNNTTNSNTYLITSNANFPYDGNTWMHVAATFDGTTSTIYINGVLDKTATYSPVTIKTNTSGLYIGSIQGAQRWKGGLDDVRLYKGALSASEIADIASLSSGARIASTLSVALPDDEEEAGVNVYPNPIGEKLHLDFKGRIEGNVSVSIVDVLGRTYFKSSGALETKNMEVDLGSGLKPGVYFLFVKSGLVTKTIKLVKE